MKFFYFRISKNLTFFMFNYDLTCTYKDNLLSPSNWFLDSNLGIPGEVGKSVKCLISYIWRKDNFKINWKKFKDIYK